MVVTGRGRWLALAVVLVGMGGAVTTFARGYVFVGSPSPAELEAMGGELLAWDADGSLMAFELGDRVILDKVVADRSPHLDFPSLPRWRTTGDWFSVPAAGSELVSAGVAPSDVGCRCFRRPSNGPVYVFGQLASDEVAFVDVQTEGSTDGSAWARHAVSGRGFIIADIDAAAGEAIRLRLVGADGSLLGEAIAVPASG